MRHSRKPPLTVAQMRAWAELHHARTGRWPSCTEGQVRGAPGEAWANVNLDLVCAAVAHRPGLGFRPPAPLTTPQPLS